MLRKFHPLRQTHHHRLVYFQPEQSGLPSFSLIGICHPPGQPHFSSRIYLRVCDDYIRPRKSADRQCSASLGHCNQRNRGKNSILLSKSAGFLRICQSLNLICTLTPCIFWVWLLGIYSLPSRNLLWACSSDSSNNAVGRCWIFRFHRHLGS